MGLVNCSPHTLSASTTIVVVCSSGQQIEYCSCCCCSWLRQQIIESRNWDSKVVQAVVVRSSASSACPINSPLRREGRKRKGDRNRWSKWMIVGLGHAEWLHDLDQERRRRRTDVWRRITINGFGPIWPLLLGWHT